MTDPLDRFDDFARKVRERLDDGRLEYEDRSFECHPDALLAELEHEALDLAGWGFILWHRVRRLRARVEAVEERHGRLEPSSQPAETTRRAELDAAVAAAVARRRAELDETGRASRTDTTGVDARRLAPDAADTGGQD